MISIGVCLTAMIFASVTFQSFYKLQPEHAEHQPMFVMLSTYPSWAEHAQHSFRLALVPENMAGFP
jgi:hypothetical protein